MVVALQRGSKLRACARLRWVAVRRTLLPELPSTSLQPLVESGRSKLRLATMVNLAGAETNLLSLRAAAAAAASSGTPVWLTALIAAIAAVLAATATALSSAYAAKRKIQEIELTNNFERANQYLESARQYTQTVYLPLAKAVHKLHTAFLEFNGVTVKSKMPAAKRELSDRINDFLAITNGQFETGASAVFTFKLDNTLTTFNAFLNESRTATESVVVNEVTVAFSLGLSGWRVQRSLARQFSSSISPYDEFAFRILGISINLRQKPELVAAPLASDDFAKRFILDVNQIKAAIKEVTLGAYNAPSG